MGVPTVAVRGGAHLLCAVQSVQPARPRLQLPPTALQAPGAALARPFHPPTHPPHRTAPQAAGVINRLFLGDPAARRRNLYLRWVKAAVQCSFLRAPGRGSAWAGQRRSAWRAAARPAGTGALPCPTHAPAVPPALPSIHAQPLCGAAYRGGQRHCGVGACVCGALAPTSAAASCQRSCRTPPPACPPACLHTASACMPSHSSASQAPSPARSPHPHPHSPPPLVPSLTCPALPPPPQVLNTTGLRHCLNAVYEGAGMWDPRTTNRTYQKIWEGAPQVRVGRWAGGRVGLGGCMRLRVRGRANGRVSSQASSAFRAHRCASLPPSYSAQSRRRSEVLDEILKITPPMLHQWFLGAAARAAGAAAPRAAAPACLQARVVWGSQRSAGLHPHPAHPDAHHNTHPPASYLPAQASSRSRRPG